MDHLNLQTSKSNSTNEKEGRGWLKKFRLSALLPSLEPETMGGPSPHELAHLLNKTIEAQIIPRLLIQHCNTKLLFHVIYMENTISFRLNIHTWFRR